jgi:hypothetical protein
MSLNVTKYEQTLKQQTAIAQKVFAAIPKSEAWTARKIYAELRRLDAKVRDVRLVEGCINTLIESGLVNEHPRGHFIRTPVRQESKPAHTNGKSQEKTVITMHRQESTKPAPVPTPPPAPIVEAPAPPVVTAPPPPAPEVETQPTDLLNSLRLQATTDLRFKHYLFLRYQRSIEMLRKMANHVDEELGLMLLEIGEDIGCTVSMQLDTALFEAFKLNPEDTLKAFEKPGSGNAEFYAKLQAALDKPVEVKQASSLPVKSDKDEILAQVEAEAFAARLAEVKLTGQRHPEAFDIHINVHGAKKSIEYGVWTAMTMPSKIKWMTFNGLTMDPRYLASFKAFLDDVGYCPVDKAHLMRADEAKGYTGDNLRWRKAGATVPGLKEPMTGWPNEEAMAIARTAIELAQREAGEALREKLTRS